MEEDPLTDSEAKLFDALSGLKTAIDQKIEQNAKMLDNEDFVEKMMMRLVIDQFKTKRKLPLTPTSTRQIYHLLVKEYMNEYQGIAV